MLTITKENFEQEVLQAKGKVLLDFWASWCGPCQMLAPILTEIDAENADLKIGKVNVDEQGELAEKFQVMSIPTMVLFNNGQQEKVTVGVMPKAEIEAWVG